MMNVMNYKGYTGTIEYSSEDKCFFGKICGISSLILYEGEDYEMLKDAFENAVEDYLVLCQDMGIVQEEPDVKVVMIDMPSYLHGTITRIADEKNCSLEELIDEALEKVFLQNLA